MAEALDNCKFSLKIFANSEKNMEHFGQVYTHETLTTLTNLCFANYAVVVLEPLLDQLIKATTMLLPVYSGMPYEYAQLHRLAAKGFILLSE